ncbi:MAG TPA: YebC/PmpR family DNA-binding transcriptional regulator, partial [Pirellulales bacterium]|nr:YebC/PmpR family DNA-binding transcriptional regulator [Pirellulales bacterium]
MAGHSHWANIAHKKSLIDAKRGKLWSKLSKAIIVAAKMSGGDPEMNLRLRYAIDAARAVSMPKDNINRAIIRGTGELDGGNLDEVMYEGYGPGGVAVLCEILTDNRNRTASEIRKVFELSGGKLGESGCVSWMFERKGVFLIPGSQIEEDALMELALEAGADD